jgi:hypothetical protein
MKSVRRTLFISVVALLVFACGGRAPLGPTPLDQGIVVYIHAGYRGTSQQIGADVADLAKAEGPCSIDENGGGGSWNDYISSIRVVKTQ